MKSDRDILGATGAPARCDSGGGATGGGGGAAYEPSGNASDKKKDRAAFSRLGFALLATVAVNAVLQISAGAILGAFFPTVGENYAVTYTILTLCYYCAAMPVGMFIMSGMPKPPERREKFRVSAGGAYGALGISFLAAYVGSYLAGIMNSLFSSLLGTTSESGLSSLSDRIPLWLFFLLTVVAAPIFEELYFRRFVTEKLRTWGNGTAIILSSLIFALEHGNVEQFFYTFLAGVVFAYVYLKTGKMRYSVALHAAFNLLGGFLPLLAERLAPSGESVRLFYEAFEELGGEVSKEALLLLVGLFGDVLPYLAVSGISSACSLGLAISGAVTLAAWRKDLFDKKFWCPRGGERRIEKSRVGETVFLAPGFILYVTVMIALMIFGFYV